MAIYRTPFKYNLANFPLANLAFFPLNCLHECDACKLTFLQLVFGVSHSDSRQSPVTSHESRLAASNE